MEGLTMPTPPLTILPFTSAHIPPAARLFGDGLRRLRARVPDLPATMEDEALLREKLERLTGPLSGLAALQDGQLAGYLGWVLIDDFRDTGRRAALVIDWMSAAAENLEERVYRALYRQAAGQWNEQRASIHAISLLAGSRAERAWFWHGFGLAVVNAIRSTRAIGAPTPPGFSLRKAELADAPLLSRLEAEHCQHYSAPPVLMPARQSSTPQEMTEFLSQPENSIFLALKDNTPAAYLQFQKESFGAASIVSAPDTIAITGAYTVPKYRGCGLAPALLEAGLAAYAGQGCIRCSVDFESFNPEAAGFWTRYFTPVTYSLMRVPENALLPGHALE
jgi:GNAT superfamily N-acetyltransferase